MMSGASMSLGFGHCKMHTSSAVRGAGGQEMAGRGSGRLGFGMCLWAGYAYTELHMHDARQVIGESCTPCTALKARGSQSVHTRRTRSL